MRRIEMKWEENRKKTKERGKKERRRDEKIQNKEEFDRETRDT